MTPGAPSLREAVAAVALSPETDEALSAAMQKLAVAAGETLDGCIFFGSRRTAAERANAHSAYDLFAVVGGYRSFYDALRRAGLSRKSPRLLTLISHVLPPTQISVRFTEPELHAKVSVIRRDALVRETSPRRRDHFTIGRLFQPTRVLASCSAAARDRLLAAVVSAHAETWRWARPWLPAAFDADGYGASLLEVSMSWEVRPEPPGRAASLWEAQRREQIPVFEALLRELGAAGELKPAGDGVGVGPEGRSRIEPREGSVRGGTRWEFVTPAGVLERLSLRIYFTVSMVRSTARWAKHVLSFEGWLDYIVRKASRHTGRPIELSERERRWPLVFLWGRAFGYLRSKNRRRDSEP